ncbi:hypothetical protein LBMAG56_06290 [Verrucomicrobiota bacterium]|nr:hypothetical protein LBMAG56_06290 [Verrucomicrobiota bacterium]
MKASSLKPLLCSVVMLPFVGCHPTDGGGETVAEGVIWTVEYKLENGKTGGFTRINDSRAVPGGNGSWNVDAYGKLTRDYLIITHPQRKDAGVEVIPANRLVSIRFGDGGIKTVAENKPAPGH